MNLFLLNGKVNHSDFADSVNVKKDKLPPMPIDFELTWEDNQIVIGKIISNLGGNLKMGIAKGSRPKYKSIDAKGYN